MDPHLDSTVRTIQWAIQDLIDLALAAAPNANQSERSEIEDEVHSTMLSLMAAVILAHPRFADGEQAFLQIILNRPAPYITNERVVNEYGSRWSALASQMPAFLKRAVEADLRNGTHSASAMLPLIQTIGNNVAITDGKFRAPERHLVSAYIANLANHIAKCRGPSE